jgi:predicted acyl esterase
LLDADGNPRQADVVTDRFHPGFHGRLRASLRELNPERSTAAQPVHTFRTQQKLIPGEIVPVEIDLWPFSIRFHAGDTLQLRVNGVDLLKRPEAPNLPPVETINSGRHVIHAGGRYDSLVLLPFIEGEPKR